jgi:DNA-directed RNA polymerase III subunit RPC4
MPPKSTRGRGGRGRGGTGRGALSESPIPVPDAVVPKQEEEGEAPPADASTTETPRQRLNSLVEPSSRSASPSVNRGRGKKASALPTNASRRSKADRDARNQEALEREKERNKDREREAQRKMDRDAKRQQRLRDNGNGRSRGGYSGAASGPFSEPSIRKDKRSTLGGLGGGYGAGSGSRGTHVKSESSHSGGRGGGGGGGYSHESSGIAIKSEVGGYASSNEDEMEAEFPRKDIDFIEVSSDDGEAEEVSRDRVNLPVRIPRKEHTERVVGINTEASSETSAKILQKVEESGSAPIAEMLKRTSTKGKGKTRDFEITGERKPYKGVWQESEDSDVKVKTEPTSDDDEIVDAEQVGIGASTVKRGKRADLAPEAERKPKIRATRVPDFQTDEERAEWERFQVNLGHIRAELGPEDDTPRVDNSGDVVMDDAKKRSRRDDFVYLFQLPPIMPDLIAPETKNELTDTPAATGSTPIPIDSTTASSTAPVAKSDTRKTAVKADVPIKKEEEFSSPLGETPERPRFASGLVGKLRVHESGRTTLDWGGTSYELTPGNEVKFLQEVVSVHVIPEKERVSEEDAGEAVSFGRIKGKFVVTPDFGQLFG